MMLVDKQYMRTPFYGAPSQVTSHAVFRLSADLIVVEKGILFTPQPFPATMPP